MVGTVIGGCVVVFACAALQGAGEEFGKDVYRVGKKVAQKAGKEAVRVSVNVGQAAYQCVTEDMPQAVEKGWERHDHAVANLGKGSRWKNA